MPVLDVFGPYNKYANADLLATYPTSTKGVSNVDVMEGGEYIRYNTAGPDFWVLVPAGSVATGRYAVMKYRILQPAGDALALTSMELFASTENETPTAGDNVELIGCLKNDGDWHLLIIDLSALGIPTFNETDGEYFAKYLRLDIINGTVSADTCFDIAFIGISDDLPAVFEDVKEEFELVDYCYGKQFNKQINTETGEEYDPSKENIPEYYQNYISPETLILGGYDKFDSAVLSDDKSYVSYKTTKLDARVTSYFTNETGRYVVLKYRIVKAPTETFDFSYVEIFSSTQNDAPTAGDNMRLDGCIVSDGTWQLLIIDVASLGINSVSESDGNYSLKYFRFDVVNMDYIAPDTSFDLAFIATGDDLDAILKGSGDEFETVTVCRGKNDSSVISTKQ